MKKEAQIALLRGVKERLFQNGWQKSSLGGIDGPNCIMGAVVCVRNSTLLRYADSLSPIALLDKLSPGGNAVIGGAEAVRGLLNDLCGTSVTSFNDHEDTSFDDIVDLIDLAIKVLEME